MQGYRYIDGVASLQVEREQCVGCGNCVQVCPHRIFSLTAEGLQISDRNLCMECGACARNCPVQAIRVTPGVGCAVAILSGWIHRALGRKFFSECC